MVVGPSMFCNRNHTAGPVTGRCGEFRWEAYLAGGPVSYGLHPGTLYKGPGRIVQLVVYIPIGQTGLWRKAAAFHRGWLFGRREHLALIRQVVGDLERKTG